MQPTNMACWMLQPEVDVSFSGLSMELQTVVQRLQLLGFNAVRLPFTFTNLMNTSGLNYTLPCDHPPLVEVRSQGLPITQLPAIHCTAQAACADRSWGPTAIVWWGWRAVTNLRRHSVQQVTMVCCAGGGECAAPLHWCNGHQ